MSEKFVWHGLKRDVRAWVDTCTACQSAKVHRNVKAPLEQFSVPERRFDHVNMDLVRPLPPLHGFTYLFTMVDRQPPTWPGQSSRCGSPATVLLLTSPLPVARSLLQSFGRRWRRIWGSSSTALLPTTRRLTDLWSTFIAP